MILKGKTILFLGSSVTYGAAAGGVSFVELMAEQCGINYIKKAVSGTTLADIDNSSYVTRLKNRLIKLLYTLQSEYNFDILDLYNDEEMLSVDKEKYKLYMSDPVHPTLMGYKEWWTPKFIKFCEQL